VDPQGQFGIFGEGRDLLLLLDHVHNPLNCHIIQTLRLLSVTLIKEFYNSDKQLRMTN
jgi:hypothetical protein